MSTYIYKARDAAAKLVKGTMDAKNKEEVVDKLYKMGYMTAQVTETLPGIKIEGVFDKLQPIGVEDMIMFNVQFSNIINAGIDILAALDMLSEQIENKKLKDTIGSISRNVEAGDSFSEALSRYPHIFSKLFVNMVKAGESSGKLDTVLSRFAEFSEHQVDLRQKIKGALFYPLILLFAGIAVTLFIVAFIIPQFAEIFMETGVKLPVPTLILYKIGTGIRHFWFSIILFVIIGCLGLRYYANTPRGRLRIDGLKLKLPIVGPIYRKSAISRFARTLGMLASSGLPILQSLDIVKEVVGNEVLSRTIANVRSSVEKGEKIGDSLKIDEEFPPDAIQMIFVGEETGNLDGMLNKISDFYDKSIGYAVRRLTTVLEPLFLVIMGSMIGFIMASMLLPIFDMMRVLNH